MVTMIRPSPPPVRGGVWDARSGCCARVGVVDGLSGLRSVVFSNGHRLFGAGKSDFISSWGFFVLDDRLLVGYRGGWVLCIVVAVKLSIAMR